MDASVPGVANARRRALAENLFAIMDAGVLGVANAGRRALVDNLCAIMDADVASAARLMAELAEMPAVTGQVFNLESRVGRPDAPEFRAE